MGLLCVCAMSVSAISCVFPQPAGAVIEPRPTPKMSISRGTCERPELVRDGHEALIGRLQRRANDVPRDFLVDCQ